MENKKDRPVLRGMRDGLPIGLGYFAVAFSLGIPCSQAGITAIQGFIMSMVNMASAGELVGIHAIMDKSPYYLLAITILITNARYLLMSTAISQKIDPKLRFSHRVGIGSCITDEIFGISITQQSPLNPKYVYGSYIPTIPLWSAGTALGIIAGNILPVTVVTALSAAIYGMFIAVVIPASRKDKVIFGVVLASFVISSLAELLPWFKSLDGSLRIIILTLVISIAAALVFPRKDEEGSVGDENNEKVKELNCENDNKGKEA